jgi:hypothetical protein
MAAWFSRSVMSGAFLAEVSLRFLLECSEYGRSASSACSTWGRRVARVLSMAFLERNRPGRFFSADRRRKIR